jgi:hypothetical protein
MAANSNSASARPMESLWGSPSKIPLSVNELGQGR